MLRGVSSCVQHAVCIVRTRVDLKKKAAIQLARAREVHRRDVEAKDTRIKVLETDIAEDRILKNMRQQINELTWELQSQPGVQLSCLE